MSLFLTCCGNWFYGESCKGDRNVSDATEGAIEDLGELVPEVAIVEPHVEGTLAGITSGANMCETATRAVVPVQSVTEVTRDERLSRRPGCQS